MFSIQCEKLLQLNGRLLKEFKSMMRPNTYDTPSVTNKLIVDMLNYDKAQSTKIIDVD